MPRVTLDEIKAARTKIAPYIRQTPLLGFDFLSKQLGKEIFLKCESLQKTGSFKLRGAANCILNNLAQAKKNGVTAASAGNHAQGVAAICHSLGISSTIVMPTITPAIKIQHTQRWGAKVELVGQVYDEAYEHAKKLSEEKGYVFIHPFRDPLIMAGQGTVGLEITEDPCFDGLEAIVIAVGGGGLMAGVASAVKAINPKIKIYGVTAKNAPATYQGYLKKSAAEEPVKFTLAEGVAAKRTDDFMVSYLTELVDKMFSISEESIAHAISILAEQGKLVVEGAGALSVAAILEGLIPEKKILAVLSGGNIDIPAFSSVLQRGLVQQGRLVRMVVSITDRPGGLNALTSVLAERSANILQVFHQRNQVHTGVGETEVEIDFESRGTEHTEDIIAGLTAKGFKVRRLS